MSLQLRSDKKRDNSIDIARGIAILGVLYGHAMAWQNISGTALTHWFWSFHMPLFALVSGYFYKERPIRHTFASSVKSLLAPLFGVSFILFFLNEIGEGISDWSTFCHEFIERVFSTISLQVSPPGFWFVIALFNCKIILAIVSKLNNKHKYLLLAVFSIIVFFLPKHIDKFEISRTFGLMIYVIIGIYAKKNAWMDKHVNTISAVILAIILLFAGLFFIDMWRYNMPLYILNLLTATVISYALIFYCKLLDQLKTKLVNPIRNVLAFCGRHSLMILSFQAILGQRFFQSINHDVHIQNAYVLMLIFVFSCVVSTVILNGIRIQTNKFIIKKNDPRNEPK